MRGRRQGLASHSKWDCREQETGTGNKADGTVGNRRQGPEAEQTGLQRTRDKVRIGITDTQEES